MYLNPAANWWALLSAAPLLSAPALLLVLFLKHTKAKRKNRKGMRSAGYSATTFALVLALPNLEMLLNHSIQHVIQEQFEEEANEDGQGDPDSPKTQINRQLRRIRRGEPVDRLILRLKDAPPAS